jgi:NTE family protein
VLGGGGAVGIAWEIGVAAGLHEAAGFDATKMEVIVGTSAGSAAGALLTVGKSMEELLAQHRRRPSSRALQPPKAEAGASPGAGTSVVPKEIMRLLVSREGSMEERGREIGKLALAARPAMTEDDFIASFLRMFGTDEWPEQDLRFTTVDVETGEAVLLTKASGVSLTRAAACSCAIPGFFRPIGFEGRRYMDGPRSPFPRRLVDEKGLEAVLFIGPSAALPGRVGMNSELDDLAATGFPVVQVGGGEGLKSLGADLMDPAARPAAGEAGILDGRAMAAEVASLLA